MGLFPDADVAVTASETGTVHVWYTGFEQPVPQGPPAGSYTATVVLRSALDSTPVNVSTTVTRSYPAEPGTGTIRGSLRSSASNALVDGRVSLGDPASVRVPSSSLSVQTAGGGYSLSVPAGTYWLWADATGYATKFVNPVTVAAGATLDVDVLLTPSTLKSGSTTAIATGSGLASLYRTAFTPDISHIVAAPGFGDNESDPNNVSLFNSAASALWRKSFGLEPSPPLSLSVGQWTATDNAVDITASGSLVAAATRDGFIAVYDTAGTELWKTDRASDVNPTVPGALGQGLKRATEVRFSLDATKLAAGGLTGHVYLFSASNGALLWKFATAGQIRALAFSPDGARVYASSGDNFLYALNVSDGTMAWEAETDFWSWDRISVTSDGTRIATGGKDGTLRVFSQNGALVWERDFPGFIHDFAFSPDGQHLIVNNGSTGIYDFAPNGSIRWFRRDVFGFKLFMSATGRFVALGFNPGASVGVQVYAIDGTPVWTLPAGSVGYRGIALTENGTRLATTDTGGNVKVFQTWYSSLDASPRTLQFAATKNGASGALLSATPPQEIRVTQLGSAAGWTAASDRPWLLLTGAAGSGNGRFTVGVSDPGTLASAVTDLTGAVTVTTTGTGTQVRIPVTFRVTHVNAGTQPPFGAVDTPANGATVQGAIPVTGWALDDVGVNRVEVWRNCLETIDRARGACASPAAGLPANYVFLGRAFLLAGARPDVEAANPAYPFAYRAGWGFMLLTNALPHQGLATTEGGQGVYELSAFAIDEEGRATRLGIKTITANNDAATLPFGALDTPVQGGTIPETATPYNDANAYPVFGWAMTQLGKCIDTTSTAAYKVFVDGVQRTLTPGTNWFPGNNRSDVAAAYPGLCNTNNAVAMYLLNAGALGLSSGLHTVSWDVTDSAGQTVAGLGTRFFNVVTTSGDRGDFDAAGLKPRTTTDADTAGLKPRTTPGNRFVEVAAGRRLALNLGRAVDEGYQIVGDARRALPAGSTLDTVAGTFAWEPPVGFFGPFALAFLAGDERIDVTVTIVDPTRAAQAVAMHVDTPIDGATIRGPLTIGGWAVDPQATTVSGIDAVHVWATRRDVPGVAPQFVGAATLGLPRPDVAMAFGVPFHAAGFQLTTSALTPGTYEVIVYARRQQTGSWDAARTVSIRID